MEKFSGTDHVRNEEVLHTIHEERNNGGVLTGLVASGVGDCFLKHVVGVNMEGRKDGKNKEEDVSSYRIG
jgi:hypothetical protein